VNVVNIYLVVPLLLIAAILQSTIMPHLAVRGVFADLPVLLVVSWSLIRGAGEGVVWGFVAGLAVDLLSGGPFGAATLSLTAIGLISGSGKSTALRANVLLPSVVMFLVTIIYSLVFLLVVGITGNRVIWLDSLLQIVLPSAVLNAALTPIVFGIMRWSYRRLSQEEMEW
jgi:rod shape-determining protein MreD